LATTGYATYGLAGDRLYRYRVFLGRAGVDLLGSDPSPVFRTQVPVGSTQPDSFAVIGDLGVLGRYAVDLVFNGVPRCSSPSMPAGSWSRPPTTGTHLRRAALRPGRGLPERPHVGDSRGASRRDPRTTVRPGTAKGAGNGHTRRACGHSGHGARGVARCCGGPRSGGGRIMWRTSTAGRSTPTCWMHLRRRRRALRDCRGSVPWVERRSSMDRRLSSRPRSPTWRRPSPG
jgi:hypothetical protein